MEEYSTDKNYQYFLDNKDELCQKYTDQFVIIENERIYKVCSSFEEALENVKELKAGTYIIQKCEEDEEKQIFHTRVS